MSSTIQTVEGQKAMLENMNADRSKMQKKVYNSASRSIQYFFKDGSVAIFVNHRYITDVKYKQDELDKEIERGHHEIRAGEPYTPDMDDPMMALKKRLREELMAEMAAATDPERDMGTSEQGKLNAQSSTDIAPVTIGQVSGARLTSLINKLK